MKHGPIALVDENLPVFVLAPHDAWREKTLSNLREVKSRDGIAIVLGTRPDEELASIADHVILVIPRRSRSSSRSSRSSRCSSSRTTSPCAAAATSTSRGISRSR